MLGTDPAARGPLTVTGMRRSGPVLVIGFEGFTDRNAAETLRGTALTLDAATLPVPDDPDEFYDHQLVGLRWSTGTAPSSGTVVEVWHPPAAPVLVVNRTGRQPRSSCRSSRRSCRSSTSTAGGWSSTRRTACSPDA